MYDPEYITYAEERGEQIHEDRLDDLRRCEAYLDAAQEHAAQLEKILDAAEAANAKHLARIDHLEGVYWRMWGENEELKQLCRDLWADHVDLCEWQAQCQTNDELRGRMEQLGLLEDCHE